MSSAAYVKMLLEDGRVKKHVFFSPSQSKKEKENKPQSKKIEFREAKRDADTLPPKVLLR